MTAIRPNADRMATKMRKLFGRKAIKSDFFSVNESSTERNLSNLLQCHY